MVAVDDNANGVLSELLSRLKLDQTEVITIYYGADTEPAEVEQISASIAQQQPQLQDEVVNGGQPHYNFVVSIE